MRRLYDSLIPTKFIGKAETKPITPIRIAEKVMSITIPIICPVSIAPPSLGPIPIVIWSMEKGCTDGAGVPTVKL